MVQHLGYLWAVTLIVWVGTLAYVMSILRRQARIQRELEAMQSRLDDLSHR
ncbi:CcmD family protein [Alicyclobacillus pomorum]|uniref:CcmD family protein n=1 Tax=Alicyclobacillus pomorum TaxID=204470 RepID=UPI00040BCA03|nr:CcmD family protein [Alicyclobacillus pomorum]